MPRLGDGGAAWRDREPPDVQGNPPGGDTLCDAFPGEVCYERAMIRRIDAWIGTRLFHPPIIWLCQRIGMTQFAVARYGWMLAAWTLVMRIGFEGVGDWIFSVLVLVVTVIETWRAAVMPNIPSRRSDGLRLIILLFAAFDLGTLIFVSARHGFPGFQWSHAWDLFALTAEYAKTIRTIPPRRQKEAAKAIMARSAPQNSVPRLEGL